MLNISPMLRFRRAGAHPVQIKLTRWRGLTKRILAGSENLRPLDDRDLQKRARELRWRANSGVRLGKLMPEAYAMVREASRRARDQVHYPVQILGGIALFQGHIAEMQTGEGKTLTAVLPAFLHALTGLGCHVITANDYLAVRDAEFTAPIFERLGMSVGCIDARTKPDDRRRAYARDVTYATAKEMGFDFLRDRLKTKGHSTVETCRQFHRSNPSNEDALVQRGNHFALVDEADSILIDDARTPLLIALGEPNDAASAALFRWCTRTSRLLQPSIDFQYEPGRRAAWLSEAGCRHVLSLPKPASIDSVDTERIYKQVERALTAQFGFARNRDYVVDGGKGRSHAKVSIVDESTGRVMDGRKWQDGLHQAIESKENIPLTEATRPAAQMTVQSFFNQYTHLAGLTGTAVQSAGEFRRIYQRKVTPIPTNRPGIRKGHPPRIFTTRTAKWNAIAKEIIHLLASGRAILAGTPSVESSEQLHSVLDERGIAHQVLNCRLHGQEAEIVRRAGQAGKVTVATNMAGRGTDINIDTQVRQTGGLHIIATELHSSMRIDRQLIGRCARQGEPGSYQFFLSLEDELLRALKPDLRAKALRRARPNESGELSHNWLPFFIKTQRLMEKLHKKQRRDLLKHEAQRNRAYDKMGLDPHLEMTDS